MAFGLKLVAAKAVAEPASRLRRETAQSAMISILTFYDGAV
jgi:hypothetical protein